LSILSGLPASSDIEHEAIKELLLQTINEQADQVAYMLQVYHPREKVSSAEVIPGSFQFKSAKVINLKISYILEEFSACSAIDTLQKENMEVTILIDQLAGELELKGEYWPERDSD